MTSDTNRKIYVTKFEVVLQSGKRVDLDRNRTPIRDSMHVFGRLTATECIQQSSF